MRSLETSLGRLLLAFAFSVGSLIGSTGIANAQGCNVVNVETVIPPDNFGHSVYITLVSELGGTTVAKCKASFPYPASGETDTVQEKCTQLESAIATQCNPSTFGTVDDCATNAKFVVFDINFLRTLSLGISNDPLIFSQTGDGQAIPDYEGDRIVNSCGGSGFASKGTFGGEATGLKIREENPDSGIIVRLDVFITDTVNLPPDPPVFDRSFTSIVSSSPGDPASTLVAAVASDLQSQIAADPDVDDLITVTANGRSLVANTSATDIGLSLISMTNDTGITSSSIGGSLTGVASVSTLVSVPALGGYGAALCSVLLLVAPWLYRRSRRA